MPGLSSGIQLALQAVLTHSQAIEIIQHNVANANTPGYRRQAPVLSAGLAIPGYGLGMDYAPGYGQRGAGVLIEKIQRFTMDLVDTRYRTAAGESSAWAARRDLGLRIESLMAETTDGGLIPALDQFWCGWQNLASDPSNLSLRTVLLDTANALTDSIRSRAQELANFRAGQNLSLIDRTNTINSVATQVAELNSQISTVLSAGDQPNDLLDRRDLLLDQLASLTGAVSFSQPNRQVIVNIGGHVLVSGTEAQTLTAAVDPADPQSLVAITWADGQKMVPSSGELKGIFEIRDNLVKNQLEGLDQLANTIIGQVNSIYYNGYGLDNSTQNTFFTGSNAFDIQVNSTVNETNLAASAGVDQPGDNTTAMMIAGLKFTKVATGNTQTINEYYNNLVAGMGVEINRSVANASHHQTLLQALGDQRESYSGVSLDEEAADLAKYQRAYQAAARVMNVYDEMLDRIINGMGISGR